MKLRITRKSVTKYPPGLPYAERLALLKRLARLSPTSNRPLRRSRKLPNVTKYIRECPPPAPNVDGQYVRSRCGTIAIEVRRHESGRPYLYIGRAVLVIDPTFERDPYWRDGFSIRIEVETYKSHLSALRRLLAHMQDPAWPTNAGGIVMDAGPTRYGSRFVGRLAVGFIGQALGSQWSHKQYIGFSAEEAPAIINLMINTLMRAVRLAYGAEGIEPTAQDQNTSEAGERRPEGELATPVCPAATDGKEC